MVQWWSKKYGKDKKCAITTTRLRPGLNKKGQTFAVFLKCGHGFCRSALQNWIPQSLTCPLCRNVIDNEDLLNIV